MFAIHHIKAIHAVQSLYEDANYLTLEFTGEDLRGEQSSELVLYFANPEPGQIEALARAINEAAIPEKTSPARAKPEINDEIPF